MNTNNAEPRSECCGAEVEYWSCEQWGSWLCKNCGNKCMSIDAQSYGEQKYQQGREEMKKEAIEIVKGGKWGGFAADEKNKLAKERTRQHDEELDDILNLLTSLSTEDTKK